MDKPILYFDMDGVLVDFASGIEALGLNEEERRQHEEAHNFDEIPGIFSLMKPIPGAIRAVKELARHYDVRILTTAPWNNPSAWTDKLLWIKRYFDDTVEGFPDGNPFHKKITITHHKDHAIGACLIEDNLSKNGSGAFPGDKIWFCYPGNKAASCPESLQMCVPQFTNWYDVLADLMPADDTSWKQYEAELIGE